MQSGAQRRVERERVGGRRRPRRGLWAAALALAVGATITTAWLWGGQSDPTAEGRAPAHHDGTSAVGDEGRSTSPEEATTGGDPVSGEPAAWPATQPVSAPAGASTVPVGPAEAPDAEDVADLADLDPVAATDVGDVAGLDDVVSAGEDVTSPRVVEELDEAIAEHLDESSAPDRLADAEEPPVSPSVLEELDADAQDQTRDLADDLGHLTEEQP